MRLLSAIGGTAILLLAALGCPSQGATLLPPGETCFSATTPTSGGPVGLITTTGSLVGGGGYPNGVYANVTLTGGSGSGAIATVTVAGNIVTTVVLTNAGAHYAVGDVLSAATASLGGSGAGFSITVTGIQGTGTGYIGLLGTITGGSSYTAGTYGGVALTGGSGSGATANITVAGGAVTVVAILNPGTGYVVGDSLSAAAANIGGTGSGFSVPVSSVAINSALAGGSVGFFIPGTTTLKQTWKDSNQTTLNTNPVTLDANGCAIIYGAGTHRQILKDASGNIIWDQLTASTDLNGMFWAGAASGTANTIIVTDPGFSGSAGQTIQFIASAANTGSATLNPSGFGAVPIVKDTTAGPVALTGNEIGAGNIVTVTFDSIGLQFHLLSVTPVTVSYSGTTIFTANGTYTPASRLAYARVTAIGGGGAGGGAQATGVGQVSCGSGGGSGGIAIRTFTATTLGVSQSVTVPAAALGASGAAGNNGGIVLFGAFLSVGGGNGGIATAPGAAVQTNGGGAGTGLGGDVNLFGNQGGVCWGYEAPGLGAAGLAGQGYLGTGMQQTTAATGFDAPNYGTGGMGVVVHASTAAATGGKGASGAVIVEEYTYQGL